MADVKSDTEISSVVFNTTPTNMREAPLFFGDALNVQRLDLPVEQWLQKHTTEALGFMWFKTDFNYSQDNLDYCTKMSPDLQNLFTKNLKFQTLLDSVAGRTISQVFMPIVSSSALEEWFGVHAFFEANVHSPAYAELVKAVVPNSTKIFDDIMVNPAIIGRAKDIVIHYDLLHSYNVKRNALRLGLIGEYQYSEREHKKAFIMALTALNVLEGVLFYSSFLISFAFSENKLMESSAKCISKIAQDENMHLAFGQYIFNRLKKLDEYKELFVELRPQIESVFKNASDAEDLWISYLFEDNPPLLGINEAILQEYKKFNIHRRMTALGLTPMFAKTENPCTWSTRYLSTSANQNANQESDNADYLLGAIHQDMNTNDFDSLLDL